MIANWKFELGHLTAYDLDGKLLCRWVVEASMGVPLAAIFNGNPTFNRRLLMGTTEDANLKNRAI